MPRVLPTVRIGLVVMHFYNVCRKRIHTSYVRVKSDFRHIYAIRYIVLFNRLHLIALFEMTEIAFLFHTQNVGKL